MSLKLVKHADGVTQIKIRTSQSAESLNHHCELIDKYFQSHLIRNHSPKTIEKEKKFLRSWFDEQGQNHGRPLYVWEAMTPLTGRERVIEYGQTLLKAELSTDTVRAYLGILRRLFEYVLENPFIKINDIFARIQNLYGAIEQPISEYDMPAYTYNGERVGVPFDPERLYEFYAVIRKNYLDIAGHARAIAARNYSALVIAGESGLRADELLHLEISDLHFEAQKIQTRFAKATRGSGKRIRQTLFTPLARDTMQYYLKNYRPQIINSNNTQFVFPSKTGAILDYASLQKALQEMINAANNAGFTTEKHMGWHWMRRIFATRFIERFPSKLSVLISLLGHTSSSTVHRYIRHSQAWMDEQIQSVLQGATKWPSIGD